MDTFYYSLGVITIIAGLITVVYHFPSEKLPLGAWLKSFGICVVMATLVLFALMAIHEKTAFNEASTLLRASIEDASFRRGLSGDDFVALRTTEDLIEGGLPMSTLIIGPTETFRVLDYAPSKDDILKSWTLKVQGVDGKIFGLEGLKRNDVLLHTKILKPTDDGFPDANMEFSLRQAAPKEPAEDSNLVGH